MNYYGEAFEKKISEKKAEKILNSVGITARVKIGEMVTIAVSRDPCDFLSMEYLHALEVYNVSGQMFIGSSSVTLEQMPSIFKNKFQNWWIE